MMIPEQIEKFRPEIGLILGSGLGFFAEDQIEVEGYLPYGEIDNFPVSTVAGHAGRFVWGSLKGKRVLCMQGRFHYYEGYTMAEVTLPVRLMHQVGVNTLIITNAAGGLNADFRSGDLMLLSDHINCMGTNPLIGPHHGVGERFPDMSFVYDSELRTELKRWAETHGMRLKEGVYLGTIGPSFETPAEIRAFACLGADAVGMSTVPEAIVATQLRIKVLGISCITNAAAGISKSPLTHEEVAETAERVRPDFTKLLKAAISLC